jgi:imidazolonepropionase-like amidohydrolase
MAHFKQFIFIFIMLTLAPRVWAQTPPPLDSISTGIFAITHVGVIPMEGEELLPDHTVIINKGRIVSIGPAEKTKVPADAQVIDGKGRYLIPGLAEMHAHIPVAKDGDDDLVRETMMLYLANGVTTIRGMLGDPYHLQLKRQVARGEILGPRIYTASPSLNGQTVQSIDQARDKVAKYKTEGYDFLKIHPGLSLEVFDEVALQAKRLKIPFAGHVPALVGINHAIDAGYASVDHLDGYLEGLAPRVTKANIDAAGFFGFNFTDDVDTDRIPPLAAKTKAGRVWVVPTQSLLERTLSPRSADDMLNEPEMKYISSALRYQWRLGKQQLMEAEGYSPDKYQRYIALRQKILRGLNRSKVGLLLGSDSPQIMNVPGFSIHREMRALADAGLPPYAILKSGTINPAIFFNEEAAYGSIRTGCSADLVLLDANPLENVDHAQRIAGVMVRGSWLPKGYIDARLAAIAAKYE